MHLSAFLTVPRRAFALVLLVRFLIAEPYAMIVYGGTPLWFPLVFGLMWAALYGAVYLEREVKNANANMLFKMFCALFHVLAILIQVLFIRAICVNNVFYMYQTDGVIIVFSFIALGVAYLLTVFCPASEVSMTFVFRSKAPANEHQKQSSSDDESN